MEVKMRDRIFYEYICSKFMCRKINLSFSWQARYHDRIVRNDDELFKIEKYIVHNPLAWERDVLFAEFLKEEAS
jgi:putative transposase